jgi:hypothetical protein
MCLTKNEEPGREASERRTVLHEGRFFKAISGFMFISAQRFLGREPAADE